MNMFTLPTGYLFTDAYSKGSLETLSIGDYGKKHNVKADFLGLTNQITGVANTECMPLQEKWVITLSTQYGCVQKCTFCDVPNVKFRGNATFEDLQQQLFSAIGLFESVKYTERMNVHFARMGEPIMNQAVFDFAKWMYTQKNGELLAATGVRIETLHPVLTTSMPSGLNRPTLVSRLHEWCQIKNELYNGQAGLQLSINSTDDKQREDMFGGSSLTIEDIAEICKDLPNPSGRKYCLNFAYSTDFIIDAKRVKKLFSPDKFMCKITPIHNNKACTENNIQTVGGYDSYTPYAPVEQALVAEGFDVLVFVPSMDEEDGLVTCGNAVLGGSTLKLDKPVIRIVGI